MTIVPDWEYSHSLAMATTPCDYCDHTAVVEARFQRKLGTEIQTVLTFACTHCEELIKDGHLGFKWVAGRQMF